MIDETQFLKAAIDYLNGNVPGVVFAPAKQKTEEMSFPCGIVMVSSKASREGITNELLANVSLKITVYADEIYATSTRSGVTNIYDTINTVLDTRGFVRTNQTEPFYNATYRKWAKDAKFTKKTNAF